MTVSYATANGTAIAGKQYAAASGTLTFLPGQAYSLQTFPVTILPNLSQSAATTTVNLTLSQPGDGATLGAIGTATLSITELPAPPPPPPPPINLVAPTLTSEQLIMSGKAITAIVLGFSKPLVAVRAQNLASFGYFAYSAGANGTFGSGSGGTYITLSSAVYNPASQSVTITPSAPLSPNTFWRVTVDGQTSTLLNNGLTDASNNLLIGSDGKVGTPLYVTFGAGKRLAYTDSMRNVVKLQLAKGGLMEMFRNAAGDAVQLDLTGTVARKTTLTGSVSRGRGGTGRTILPPIVGSAGVRVRLKSLPFAFRATPLVADAEISNSSAGSSAPAGTMAGRALMQMRRR